MSEGIKPLLRQDLGVNGTCSAGNIDEDANNIAARSTAYICSDMLKGLLTGLLAQSQPALSEGCFP
jgi:hypothetical protein